MLRLLVILVLLAPALPASAQVHFTLHPSSRMWIEGSSTVNRFTCTASHITGEGTAPNRIVQPARHQPVAAVQVEVRAFDCGNGRMNSDLYRALKADTSPTITFTLDAVEGRAAAQPGVSEIHVRGALTLAGASRNVAFSGTGHRSADGRLHFTGELPLLMSDFGVEPPSALMGLIRAHDALTVHFDLTAQPSVSAD